MFLVGLHDGFLLDMVAGFTSFVMFTIRGFLFVIFVRRVG